MIRYQKNAAIFNWSYCIFIGVLLDVPAVKLKKKVSFKEEVKVEFTDILDQEVNHNNKAHEIRGEQILISLFSQ